MMNLLRKALVAAMLVCIASTGVFAQKDNDKRPKKEDNRVVVKPKGEKPPPQNDRGRDDKKGDKRGKP